MPGPLYHVGASAVCPHGGQVQVVPTTPRVLVGGQPVATLGDVYPIAGCAYAPGGSASPCLTAQWIVPAVRVLVNGQPAILQTSTGLGIGPGPQGPVTVVATQPRVIGT